MTPNEIARAAGTFEYLCECGGQAVWCHHPHGTVLAHVTPEEHRAAFTAEELNW